MRILHVVQSLDPAWGGIARVLPMLASELAAAGESCRVATLGGGRYGTPPNVPGVEVLAFDAPSSSPLGRSPEFDRRIDALVGEADVVHLHGLWTGQNRSAGRAARRAGKPYVITPHSMMMPWSWRRSRWKKMLAGWWFEHRNLRGAAALHALADGEADAIRALDFNDRVIVIPNGLHVDDFEHPPSPEALIERFPALKGRRWLLFLGRLSPQKGFVPTMQACFDVVPAAREWHLVVAGPDEFGLRRMLEAGVARKKLSDRVTITGMLSRTEVLACLGRASLLLQPSLSEGLSLSIIEALAAGLPVLISPACNLPEVAAEEAGRLVEPARRPIAAALREMVGMDAAALKAMGQRGRALARARFDWRVLVSRYQEMYAGLRSAVGLSSTG